MELSNPDFLLMVATNVSIMLLIFLVNYFVLSTLVFKPTLKILNERYKKLGGMTKEADYFTSEFQKKYDEYQGLMEEARHIARHAREEILKGAEQEKQEILGNARKYAEERLNKARADLASNVDQARGDLKSQAQVISDQIVSKVLGKAA